MPWRHVLPHPGLEIVAQQFSSESDLGGAPESKGFPSVGHGYEHRYAMQKSISVGKKTEQGDARPDAPFRGDIGDIYIVNATPAYVGQVLFD